MHSTSTMHSHLLRPRPLAAAFAAILTCSAQLALALQTSPLPPASQSPRVQVVSNCNDSGAGSLRDAVTNAIDGETIDLTQLSCSFITLSTGAILIGAQDLTLDGPGADLLNINSAGYAGNGVIYDLAGGTLKIDGVSVAFGSKYRSDANTHGGCIYSAGNVMLTDTHVYACTTRSVNAYDSKGGAVYAQGDVSLIDSVVNLCGVTVESGSGQGGGVFAGGNLTMGYSTISGCRIATATAGVGGGAYVAGDLFMKYSTVSDNLIDEATVSDGGGLHTAGDVDILWSTISGNNAVTGGGLSMTGGNYGHTAQIRESTISGNTAQSAGGVKAWLPLELFSSTIAFNTIPRHYSIPLDYAFSAGLALLGSPVRIESSIIANNVAFGDVDDPEDIGGELSLTFDGSNNLIQSSAQPTPPDTIAEDPRLASLADNGGLTATHALFSGSPALDRGNNLGNFSTDQRGVGFARELNNRADIGAYESDADLIFSNGFD